MSAPASRPPLWLAASALASFWAALLGVVRLVQTFLDDPYGTTSGSSRRSQGRPQRRVVAHLRRRHAARVIVCFSRARPGLRLGPFLRADASLGLDHRAVHGPSRARRFRPVEPGLQADPIHQYGTLAFVFGIGPSRAQPSLSWGRSPWSWLTSGGQSSTLCSRSGCLDQ
jgi:hypothetical protein